MKQFILKQPDWHLVIEVDGKQVLMDSGAPASVGDLNEWTFIDQTYPLLKSYQGATTEFLSQEIGTKIDILLGSDILGNMPFLIDAQKGIVVFDPDELALKGVKVPLYFRIGIPMITVILEDNPIPLFLDTGAKISCLKKELVGTKEQVGSEKDFYPGNGDFETAIYHLPMRLAVDKIMIDCGILPQMLELALLSADCSGIIGTQLFKEYKVLFSYPKNEITLFKYEKID